MRFRGYKEYRGDANINSVSNYLLKEHTSNLRDNRTTLANLDFSNNFKSFTETVTIPALTEVSIVNRLDIIPTRRVVVRHTGDPLLVDGDTEWDINNVTHRNAGMTSLTATVVFME